MKRCLPAIPTLVVGGLLAVYSVYAFLQLTALQFELNEVTVVNESEDTIKNLTVQAGLSVTGPLTLAKSSAITLRSEAVAEGTFTLEGDSKTGHFQCNVGYVDAGFGAQATFWVLPENIVEYALAGSERHQCFPKPNH